MTSISSTITSSATSSRIWLVSTSFVLLQFFLQLSSGVIIGSIMREMHLSPLSVGALSSSFYIIYTLLQIPVGILCDSKNLRPILTTSAFVCGLGCLVFASSYHLSGLYIGRFLIGVGSAFAFVSLTHLISHHYPKQRFAFLIGVSETLSFIVTVLGIIGMGTLITHWGWRGFIKSAGLIAFGISYLCWHYLPNEPKPKVSLAHYAQQLTFVLTHKLLWINGLFIGLSFSIVTVFGALWAVPFLEIKLGCSMRLASLTNAMFFLGTAVSCPLFGILTNRVKRRKPLIMSSCLITAGLLLLLLYIPTHNLYIVSFLMFMIGLCCGAYILAYPISNELATSSSLSTCTGFTNTLALVTTPLLQPLIGYLLELSSTNSIYTLANYQTALLILPVNLCIACFLVKYLNEKSLH